MPDVRWYKDALFYQLPVRAYYDSNEDGIGDFAGLTQKLDYVAGLGITALWLLPFYPSPLRDDGYDITDYTAVHPDYGSLADFERFLAAAHERGLRVLIDLVLNHTSDQHPWFQRARRSPAGSPERDFYVWNAEPAGYPDARIIFADTEPGNWTWDAIANAYYWHRFYAHEPDLNYEQPAVRQAMTEVVDFWLERGVDGIGLAAVSYLYERPGTTGENLPETHAFLKQLRAHVAERFGDRLLLAQANAWPEDAAAYLQSGDECQMAAHFPLSPRLFMAVRSEDRFPVVDILKQTPPVPDTCGWVTFLRNQDELTLQMVTDEERDYMYRSYANDPRARLHYGIRRRLAPLLGNDRRQVELLNGLLFSLTGAPVIYYGDEIGMGDNVYLGDRAGVRTPMQWSGDRNAGFSLASPQRLYAPVTIAPEYHYETINVETQQRAPSSLLWWTRRLIALRGRYPALSAGALQFVPSENRKVLSFIRRCPPGEPGETVLVVANLSRFAEYVALDLSEFAGFTPIEMMGRRAFPVAGQEPYLITLAPYAFYWFALRGESQQQAESEGKAAPRAVPVLPLAGAWPDIFQGEARRRLEAVLPGYVRERRWFRGKARALKGAELSDTVPLPYVRPGDPAGALNQEGAVLALVRVDYEDGDPETYVIPMTVAAAAEAGRVLESAPYAAIAWLDAGDGAPALLYDAMWDPALIAALLDAIETSRVFAGPSGAVAAEPTRAFARLRASGDLPPRLGSAEQSNTSVVLGDRLIMKLFRRIEEGINPDVEVTRFLTERTSFTHSPPLAGALSYRPAAPAPGESDPVEPMSLGILQGFVANEGDAWAYTLDALGGFIERANASPKPPPDAHISTAALLDLAGEEPPALAREIIGDYLRAAQLLGQRTAEMHLALASGSGDPDFAPEPFTLLYQRGLYQSMRTLQDNIFDLARRRLSALPEDVQAGVRELLGMEATLLRRFHALTERKANALRIRTHGDYHLGQVLYTGGDFIIIDYEGEPGRPLSERRFKRGALRDVAGMLRSFQYAAYGKALFDRAGGEPLRAGEAAQLDAWARYWQLWTCATYLRAYLETAGGAPFLPAERAELSMLLDAYLLEKAVYELGYELNNRPGWVTIPVQSILQLLRG